MPQSQPTSEATRETPCTHPNAVVTEIGEALVTHHLHEGNVCMGNSGVHASFPGRLRVTCPECGLDATHEPGLLPAWLVAILEQIDAIRNHQERLLIEIALSGGAAPPDPEGEPDPRVPVEIRPPRPDMELAGIGPRPRNGPTVH